MVKSYLRYVEGPRFGVIASPTANAVFDATGKCAVAAALEDVVVWNLKQGESVQRWHDADNTAEVTAIVRCQADPERFAVGYADGAVRVWTTRKTVAAASGSGSTSSAHCLVTFRGHASAVTALAFDRSGTRLATGARDTDLILWDLVGETGLFRLRGHKDQITAVHFLYANEDTSDDNATHLITSSKDALVKVWDITTQHCVETVVGHRSEVWTMALTADGQTLITGTSDQELKVWRIRSDVLRTKIVSTADAAVPKMDAMAVDSGLDLDEHAPKLELAVVPLGAIGRQSKERAMHIAVHPTLPYFAVQTADRLVEIFKILDEDERKRKLNRRRKRMNEKKSTGSGKAHGEDGAEPTLALADEFPSLRIIRASAKVRSFDFAPASAVTGSKDAFQLLVTLMNNSMEVYAVPVAKDAEATLVCALDRQGHRSDIRTMALSSDDEMLLSAGNGAIKVWNLKTEQCMRTLPAAASSFAVCCTFVPGNRYILVGTKTGDLEIYDTWSSTLIETVRAHDGCMWSIDVRPDKKGFVTGGADKEVKFWDFAAVEDVEVSTTSRRLTVLHMRTLRMSDEVLAVKYSPNQNLIAVSLLDSTVKVFFHDTLKFFLSLYGHKLPVLSMDISSDNQLLVTASADKNVKLWGLDFGDCHKSLFAHTDSIMSVRFVQDTHYFFTCSKDHAVKYWDGDKFEQIMKMPSGHHGEVWAMCVGRWGNVVVTGGQDKSIRVWTKTDEQLFLEEERELEMEQAYERDLVDAHDKADRQRAIGQGDDEEAEDDGEETGVASRKTVETLKSGEKVMEALDLAEQEYIKWQTYEKSLAQGMKLPPPERHPLLKALGDLTPEQHVLQTVEKIRASNLDEALLVLPFAKVTILLRILGVWVERQWNTALTCRILMFLLRTHHRQITANRSVVSTTSTTSNSASTATSVRSLLEMIRGNLRRSIQQQKDQIGYNVAAVKFLRRQWEMENVAEFVDWEKDVEQLASHMQKVGAVSGTVNGGKKGGKKTQRPVLIQRVKVVGDKV